MPDYKNHNDNRPFYAKREERRPLKGENYGEPRRASRPDRPIPRAVQDDAEGERFARPHHDDKPRFERRDDRPRFEEKPRFERRDDKPRFERRDDRPKFDRPAYDKPRFEPKPHFEEKPHFDRPPMPPMPQEEAEPENLLAGRNPIREAIKSGRPVEKLLVAEGELSGSAREIVAWAREANVIVQFVDRRRLDAIYPNHQGMLAYVAAAEYSTLEDILAKAEEKGEAPFIVICDGITDPHNLGAIIRTAECCGAHGVIVPERRSAGLSPAAVKASAGAVEYLPVAKVGNLARTIDDLKKRGIWVIGTAVGGQEGKTDLVQGPVAIVIGSEGEGMSRLIEEKCDLLVRLPMRGHIESLNASVAAGMIMYDVVRAREAANGKE